MLGKNLAIRNKNRKYIMLKKCRSGRETNVIGIIGIKSEKHKPRRLRG
jgi:hypothetical protein